LAMMRLFNTQPDMKIIYIAPLKALVRERMDGWGKGLVRTLGKKMVKPNTRRHKLARSFL
jgi:activating signal cointegrator complex subunit 3